MGEAGADFVDGRGADVALVGAICLVLSPSAAARRDLGLGYFVFCKFCDWN